MARENGEKTVRKHIWVYESDWNEIVEIFGSNIGTSKTIRIMIRKMLRGIKAKGEEGANKISDTNVASIIEEGMQSDD